MTRPYEGRRAALASMHRKEVGVAPPFRDHHGLTLVVPPGIDTDALGAFTGEVPRRGTMRETAVAKARLGMEATGLPLGLASEGSYGAHPLLPFARGGMELLVLVDDERGMEVVETLVLDRTNAERIVVAGEGGEALEAFLDRVGFPSHGVVVRPDGPTYVEAGPEPEGPIKGVRTRPALAQALEEAAAASSDGRARVETDLRAHVNPTRMEAIRQVAERLARRLLVPCPGCRAPGFGFVRAPRGLPCRVCGTATQAAAGRLFGCAACDHTEERTREDGRTTAEPRVCPVCNP
jgi:hypothetical protein